MELGIATGTLQIISLCAQCTVALARWIGEVKTVDDRIEAFIGEIDSLSATYNALESNLRSPAMRHVALTAEESAGGSLWKQVARSMSDCEDTMVILHRYLRNIEGSSSGRLRRPYKQFKESIMAGDIARLRQRIQFFNSTLALPLQMLTVTFQVEQRETSTDHQQRLDARLLSLNQTIDRLTRSLALQNRSTREEASSTMCSEDEKVIYERMGSCIETARKFSSSNSVISGGRSGINSVRQTVRQSSLMGAGITSLVGEPLSHESRTRIENWVSSRDADSAESQRLDQSEASPPTTPVTNSDGLNVPAISVSKSEGDEFDVDLTQRFLENGQTKLEQHDFVGAAACFNKALSKLSKHDLEDRVNLKTADAQVLLASALMGQNRLEDAEELLLPVTQAAASSVGAAVMTACHILGELCLKKGDLDMAEQHSLMAVKGRGKLFGKQNVLCLQSVHLLIQVYDQKGDYIEAEAWNMFIPTTPEKEVDQTWLASNEKTTPSDGDQYNSSKKSRGGNPQKRSPWSLLFRKSSRSQTTLHSTSPSKTTERYEMPASSPSPRSFSARGIPGSQRGPALVSRQVNPYPAEMDVPSVQPPEASETSALPIGNTQATISGDKPPQTLLREMLVLYTDRGPSHRYQAASGIFCLIADLCRNGKHSDAAAIATQYLKTINVTASERLDTAIQTNVLRGGILGLTATGHGYAALHAFAGSPMLDATELGLLVDQGVDVNAECRLEQCNGPPLVRTALQLAIERGHTGKVRKLLESKDIQLEHQDEDGLTPLFKAFQNGLSTVVELLLDCGARTDHYQNGLTNSSLLHEAASCCDLSLINLLLSRNEPVDWLNLDIRTPLLYTMAVPSGIRSESRNKQRAGLKKTVLLLLEAGADISVKDTAGWSAEDYARENGYTDIVSLLAARRTQGVPVLDVSGPEIFYDASGSRPGSPAIPDNDDWFGGSFDSERPVLWINTGCDAQASPSTIGAHRRAESAT